MNRQLIEKIVRQEIRKKLIKEGTLYYRKDGFGPARSDVMHIRRRWIELMEYINNEKPDDDTLDYLTRELDELEAELKELGYEVSDVIPEKYRFWGSSV